MRKPRFQLYPGAMVEITHRTIQGRFLLKPSQGANEIIVGCLGRAQKQHPGVRLHAVAFMSNHYHLLASFDTVQQMSGFMGHFAGNLSKEMGKLHGWRGSMFDGRFRSTPVSDEPRAHIARLKYILSQGAKEGLVLSPHDWPGVHSAGALASGDPLQGVWIDRTKLHAARQRNPRQVGTADVTTVMKVHLEPLPCWVHLQPEQQRQAVVDIIDEIEREVVAGHRVDKSHPVGAAAVLQRLSSDRPAGFERSPAPLVHAFSKDARVVMLEALRNFVAAFRRAAERLKAGDRRAEFPQNCFPPGLPFVQPVPV